MAQKKATLCLVVLQFIFLFTRSYHTIQNPLNIKTKKLFVNDRWDSENEQLDVPDGHARLAFLYESLPLPLVLRFFNFCNRSMLFSTNITVQNYTQHYYTVVLDNYRMDYNKKLIQTIEKR